MKIVPIVALLVARDAMTRLPVTVPVHEVEIVKLIFGEDNVQVTDEAADKTELDPSTEGERLANKYGTEPVIRIYGENFKGAIARACEGAAIPAKQAKA